MTTTKEIIEREFQRLRASVDVEAVRRAADELRTSQLVNTTSILGTSLGASNDGVTALTAAVDDVLPNVTGSAPLQQTGQLVVAQLTSGVSGIGDLMTSNGSNLDVVIAMPTAQALTTAASKVATNLGTPITPAQVDQIAGNVLDLSLPLKEVPTAATGAVDDFELYGKQNLQKALSAAVGGVVGLPNINNLKSTLSKTISTGITRVTSELARGGFGSIIQNTIENSFENTRLELNKITTTNGVLSAAPESVLRRVIEAIDVGDYAKASQLLAPYTDRQPAEVRRLVGQIKTSAASLANQSSEVLPFAATQVKQGSNRWSETEPNLTIFVPIRSRSELIAELQSVEREVTEILIHWSGTYIDQNYSASDLHRIAIQANGKGIESHYVITRNGVIERGRPVEVLSPELPNNHHQRSIGVVMVGGINSGHTITQTSPESLNYSSASYTRSQWTALNTFFTAAFTAYPGMQALGHGDIEAGYSDPGFDVRDYIRARFNKVSRFTNPLAQEPFTRDQLLGA